MIWVNQLRVGSTHFRVAQPSSLRGWFRRLALGFTGALSIPGTHARMHGARNAKLACVPLTASGSVMLRPI